jgi:DNA polymerase-3 subunit gamma/tau
LNLIAKYADGSLRDADGILEQLSSFGENDITVDDVSSLLGMIDIEMLFELANILIEKNLNQALLFIHRIISSSINLKYSFLNF